MATAFQPNAFQNNAFQIDAGASGPADFNRTDVGGKARRGVKHKGYRSADDELTEAEIQFMQRKLAELKAAKTEREKAAAAKSLEVAMAQATKDDEAADAISATIQEKRPEAVLKSDYGAVMRDVALPEYSTLVPAFSTL